MMVQMAFYVAVFMVLFSFSTVLSADTIPADKAAISSWFQTNIGPLTARKASLDPELVTAEEAPKIIKVNQDGSGEFKTVQAAIDSVPTGNTKRTIIWIGPGDYTEKITIDRTKPFITFYGSPNAIPKLTYSGTALKYGTVDSASLIVESNYFTAFNLIIANSSPRPDGVMKGAQAVALRISGDKASFYNCKMLGFQDTVCDDKGKHFFKDCYIEGTVDFIFGSGKSLYVNTELHIPGAEGFTVITAQAREQEAQDVGYSFAHCSITGDGKGVFLGRAWQTRPKVVFSYTDMGPIVHPEGWSNDMKPDRDSTVFFGEYKNTGPGAAIAGRAKFTKQLSEAEVQPFLSLAFIEGSKWLLPPPKVSDAPAQ